MGPVFEVVAHVPDMIPGQAPELVKKLFRGRRVIHLRKPPELFRHGLRRRIRLRR